MLTRRFSPLFALAALAGCAMQPAGPGPDIARVSDNPMTRAALAQTAQVFPNQPLAPGHYVWVADKAIPATGPIRVLVSLRQQRAWIFRNEQMIGMTTVSTGMPGHPTVPGHWPILQKAKFHKSNKYSDAPMPFMQRLDQYGIALHAGTNPGYPASHGCIRLPLAVAKRLYSLTKLGDPVDIES
ncbi:L,D-transpeptidase family protein [Sphingomonas sp. ASV193]|uniref:L,D-transpeptidase family protein n=1 Tax=Sphingomonas sp. ASV193 TaxID=3144405 RepID=UPI0032E911CE